MEINSSMTEVPITYKPVQLFALEINGLVSIGYFIYYLWELYLLSDYKIIKNLSIYNLLITTNDNKIEQKWKKIKKTVSN